MESDSDSSGEFFHNTDSYDESDSEYEPALRDSLLLTALPDSDDEPAFKDSLLNKLLPDAISDNDYDTDDQDECDDPKAAPSPTGVGASAVGPTQPGTSCVTGAESGEWQWTDIVEDVPFINKDITFNPPKDRLSAAASCAATELDHLNLYLNTPIIDDIVKYTNLAALQSDRPGHPSVTKNSVLAYLGLNIAMGMVVKFSIEEYWTRDIIFDTPFFRKVMTEKWFLHHQKYLHVVDGGEAPTDPDGKLSDGAYMIRPVLDSFSKSFQEHYHPSRELRVDKLTTDTESIFFSHYGPTTQSYLTLWTLSESETHYCLNFKVQEGRTDERLSIDILDPLMAEYLSKGHVLYLSNLCTSLQLLKHLLEHKTLAIGTILGDCEYFPARLRAPAKLKDGEAPVVQSNDAMTVCRWPMNFVKREDVFLASTLHGKSFTVTRVKKGRGRHAREESVRKPTVVHDYNANMDIFNFSEECLSFHPLVLRSGEWWQGAFWRLLDVAIVNAFALWKHKGLAESRKGQHNKFRVALAEQLAKPYMEEQGVTI